MSSGITSRPAAGCFTRDLLSHQGVLQQEADLSLKAAPSATSQSPFSDHPTQHVNGCSAVLLPPHLNVQCNGLLTISAFN